VRALAERAAGIAGGIYLVLLAAFMLWPVAIVTLVSFSPTPVFDVPTEGASLQWYRKLADLDELWPAVRLSAEVGAIASVGALMLGSLCALGLRRGRLYCPACILAFLMSPLMLPGIVLGVAMLITFRATGFLDAYTSLVLAHIVITVPYVVRVLYAALGLFDFTMIDAARTLGYSHPVALWKVLVPNLLPSFVTAGMFAFLMSVDNYALALFLGDVRTVTLPIELLKLLDRAADPTVAAIATLMVAFTAALLVLGERLIGAARLVGRSA
jgi:putative spermidine/putrescine transport system permease protein